MKIRLAGVVEESIVDGPGIRYTIFVQGCPHKCKGCHNAHTHSYDGGYIAKTDELYEDIMANPLLTGVTFSGGEPFCYGNELADLGSRLKARGMNIITYSGYTFEELLEKSAKDSSYLNLLKVTNILIDGRFEEEQKDLLLKFRGSKNQRILDCAASLASGKAAEIEL